MFTIAASYGYLTAGDNAEDWQADAIIHSASELSQWI
jgi:phosphoglycolate phosphatase-like HAD superfamily hydrolase